MDTAAPSMLAEMSECDDDDHGEAHDFVNDPAAAAAAAKDSHDDASTSSITSTADARAKEAAVGSISHILRTLFRQLYEDQEQKKKEHELQHLQAASARVPADDYREHIAAENAEEEAQDIDRDEHGPTQASGCLDAWYGSFHHIKDAAKTSERAKRRMEQISSRLSQQRQQADQLLQYISIQSTEAALADKEDERELKRRGLLVNAHIPMTSSHLTFDSKEMSNGGHFSTALIVASGLIEENRRALAKRNGLLHNGHDGNEKGLRAKFIAPGYLKMTSSNSIRQQLALHRSHGPNGLKFEHREGTSVYPFVSESAEVKLGSAATEKSANTTLDKVYPNFEQLELENKIGSRMDRKLNYLRNPRFDKSNPNYRRRLVKIPQSPRTSINCRVRLPATPFSPVSPEVDMEDPSIFIVDPAAICFDNYTMEAGHYENVITIRNGSAVSRRLQLLRPRCPVFTLSQLKWPGSSAGSGTLAPGMALRLILRFTPSKMTTYEDAFVVLTEEGRQRVELKAICEPSILTLPQQIDVAPCFVGENRSIQLSIENKGSAGHFQLLQPNVDEESSVRVALPQSENEDVLVLTSAFTIRPAGFYLGRNSQVELELTFSPSNSGEHRATFLLKSETSHVATHSIVGHADCVKVTLQTVDGQAVDDSCQPQFALPFCGVVLGATLQRQFEVFNAGKLPLEFEWLLRQTKGHEEHSEILAPICVAGTLGVSIEPQSGILQPGEMRAIAVIFTPQSIDPIDLDGIMVIKSVPRMSTRSLRVLGDTIDTDLDLVNVEAMKFAFTASVNALRLDMIPSELTLPEPLILGASFKFAEHAITIHNPSSVSVLWRWGTPREHRSDVCPSYLDPIARLTSESLAQQNSNSSFLEERREERCTHAVDITWDQSAGEIGPGERVECAPTIIARRCGFAELTIPCYVSIAVDNRKDKIQYEAAHWVLQACVQSGKLRFLAPEVNFGLIAINARKEIALPFVNDNEFPLYWSFAAVPVPEDSVYVLENGLKPKIAADGTFNYSGVDVVFPSAENSNGPETSLEFEPREGLIGAGESGMVKLVCRATLTPRRLSAAAVCQMRYLDAVSDTAQYVGVRGEVQALDVCLYPQSLDLGVVYNGVPVEQSVQVTNNSSLPTTYSWERVAGQTAPVNIELSPCEGVLAEHETKTVRVKFTSPCPGILDEVVNCVIAGMPNPLRVELKATCKAALMVYEVLPDGSDPPAALAAPHVAQLPPGLELPVNSSPPTLDFGNDVPLFERRTLRFVIRNISAVQAPFELKLDKYPAAMASNSNQMQSRGAPAISEMFGRTDKAQEKAGNLRILEDSYSQYSQNFKTFSSTKGREYAANKLAETEDRMILRDGHGIAFQIEPRAGVLPPWGTFVVSVTAFNNLAGNFCDNILCSVQGMPLARLPVRIAVSGCPLSLQPQCLGLDLSHNKTPLLKFGQVLLGYNTKTVKRHVRVRNAGPLDAVLNWQMGPDDGSEDSTQEDRIVNVLLRPSTDDPDRPLTVTIRQREDGEYAPPFSINPATLRINAYSQETVTVSLPGDTVAPGSPFLVDKPSQFCATLWANAEWLKPQTHASNIKDGPGGNESVKERAFGNNEQAGNVSTTAAAVTSNKRSSGFSSIASIAAKMKHDRSRGSKGLRAMKIRLRAALIEPKLHVDKEAGLEGRHTLQFTTSSIIVARAHSKRAKKGTNVVTLHNSLSQKISFKNPTDVDISLRLSATSPFFIGSVNAGASVIRRVDPDREFVLHPRQIMTVETLFEPDIASKNLKHSGASKLKFEFNGSLTAKFTTGLCQAVYLHGDVLRPLLVASLPSYQYGLVRIGCTAELLFFLSNPTTVDAAWKIKHVSRSHASCDGIDCDNAPSESLDDPSVFELSECSGNLCGPRLPVSSAVSALPKDFNRSTDAMFPQLSTELTWKPKSSANNTLHGPATTTLYSSLAEQAKRNPRLPHPMTVRFSPTKESHYCSRFRFLVEHGESFDIVLHGTGTSREDIFDETCVRMASCNR